MSLTASMWTGVSGLLAHGEKMNVVGNNLANVSTVGFKGQRMDFADFVYQNTYTSAGTGQIGRGVKIGAIMQNFSTGSFESTTEATDLAITGRGFFKVKKIGSDQSYYTRAGNFRFNYEGYLVDPNGLAVQGWKVDNNKGVTQAAGGMTAATNEEKKSDIIGAGVPMDVRLDSWTVDPQQTTKMTFKAQLPHEGLDKARDSTNPFAAMFQIWDGRNVTQNNPSTAPIAEQSFGYQTTMEVYDEAGAKHKITIYYDRVSPDDYDSDPSQDIWEYMVTMDPAEDKRMYADDSTNPPTLVPLSTTKVGGILMTGTLTFNSAGQLTNQSAYTWGGSINPTDDPNSFSKVTDPTDPARTVQVINRDPTDMENWVPAAVSSNGYPIVVANFSGVLDAQTSGSPSGQKYNIEMDFGLRAGNLTIPWENGNSLASLKETPYVRNPNFVNGTNKTEGPEFVLINPDYDPQFTSDPFDPRGYQYLFDVPGYNVTGSQKYPTAATPATPPDEYDPTDPTDPFMVEFKATVLKYKGVTGDAPNITGTGVIIPAGSADNSPTNLWPPVNIVVQVDGTGAPSPAAAQQVFAADGTPKDPSDPPEPGDFTLADVIGEFTTKNPGGNFQATVLDPLVRDTARKNPVLNSSVMAAAEAAQPSLLAEFNKPIVYDSTRTTNYEGSFSASQAQNGYGYGDLSSWDVDANGVLYGVYSNGVTLPLWQLTLYDFTCTQGLRREGNNLFSQTRDSGEAKWGPAGVAGLGGITSYHLEQSNVDMSTEFVQMISTQRGFQSNSKLITTTDTMLETVINMKR
ncbi:MAG: flagellar hook-basal body complex protein [Desulfovibrionaceae bacterium]|nr:flagellar hook-basal body complex protein [Desulfovibrionaceae bacterium]